MTDKLVPYEERPIFERGDLATINQDHRQRIYTDDCPRCHVRVVIHCDRCKIQVTSCMCLMKEQLREELDEDALRRMEDESRRDRMRYKGFHV